MSIEINYKSKAEKKAAIHILEAAVFCLASKKISSWGAL